MLKDKVTKIVIVASKKIAKSTVNSTCSAFIYQEKVSKSLKKLRKF